MRHGSLVTLGLASMLLPLGRAAAQGGAVDGKVSVPGTSSTGVVVYMVPEPATNAPAAAPIDAEINQLHLRFSPGVIAVTPGSTIAFPNSDPVFHNVFHPSLHGGFDLGIYPQGERRSFTFKEEGAFAIFCHVHPEMVAYVVVVNSPYRAVTDDAGHFRLEGIAPGRYRLTTWHRRLRTWSEIVTVAVNGELHVNLSLAAGAPDKPQAGNIRSGADQRTPLRAAGKP